MQKDLLRFTQGISIHVLNMGLIDHTPSGKLILTVMLAFAEFERDMIVERTQEGREIARQNPNYRDGRKKKYTPQQMGNTIRLNNKQPAEEWLIMSNTGTDIFLELIINAASAGTVSQNELISYLRDQKEINDIAPGTASLDMEDNVQNVSGSADNISSHIGQLNKAKDQLMEIISDLSAISEENAASTEETNASMEELNATFSIITESASKLQVLAENMTETISYFKT